MDPPHARRTTRGVTISGILDDPDVAARQGRDGWAEAGGGMTQFSNWLAWLARQKMIAGVPCTWGRPRICVLPRDRGGDA